MKVVGYIRVSTDSQADNTSRGTQKKAIAQFCKQNGYELVQIFEDVDSGRKEHRLGFDALLNALKTNGFDGVVAWKIDRLFRGMYAMSRVFKTIEKKNKFIHTTDGIDSRTPHGSFLIKQMGLIAELEADHITQRMIGGRKANFRKYGKVGGKGKGTAGRLPFGYRYINGEIVPHDDSLKLVEGAFRLYGKGWSIGTIAKSLNEHAETPHGNKFSPQTVTKMLKNVFYRGDAKYSGETIKDHHEPLINRTLWYKVQRQLKAGFQGKRARQKADGTRELPAVI